MPILPNIAEDTKNNEMVFKSLTRFDTVDIEQLLAFFTQAVIIKPIKHIVSILRWVPGQEIWWAGGQDIPLGSTDDMLGTLGCEQEEGQFTCHRSGCAHTV